MAIQLVLFDCEKQQEITVASTEIVIGRDSILRCDDKRISRQHGIIKHDGELAGRSIQITSTHANPIFLRTSDQVLNILTKDLTATLRHGERFALLPDQYWFEVRFRDTDAEEPVSSSSAGVSEEAPAAGGEEGATGGSIRVRTMEEVNSAVTAEEARVLPDWIGGSSGGEKRKNGDDSEADSSKKARSEEEPVVKVDPDSGEASTSQGKPTSSDDSEVKPEIKKETADSTSSPLRPSCEFGVRCYRRTLEHRTQFAHPNDSDYRRPTFPPAPSDAPHCPYEASCYRRNPQHFRDFQHPDSSEYRRATVVTPAAVIVTNQQNPAGANQRNIDLNVRRHRRRLARDLVIAAMVDPNLFDDDSDELDEDDLFGDGDDSDEYLPGRGGGNSDEDDDDDDSPELAEDENEE